MQISHPETEEGASEMVSGTKISGTNMSVQSKPWQNPTTGRSYTVIARKFNDHTFLFRFSFYSQTRRIFVRNPP